MLYRVEGIVIRSVPYGEGNTIITIFTEEYGKVGLMVRGARKARSRYAAVSQLHTHGIFVYYQSKAGSLGTLNDAEVLSAFPEIASDLRNSAYAAYFAELIDRFVPEGEASAFLYGQYKAALEAIQAGKDPMVIAFMLELRLFQFSGIAPVMEVCAQCGHSPKPGAPAAWSVESGGMLYGGCTSPDALPLPPASAKLLRLLARTDLRSVGQVHVRADTKHPIKRALRHWMDAYAGVTIKSRNVLDQIEAVFEG
jgi:DNA repair protein RecO (recombination protein O)